MESSTGIQSIIDSFGLQLYDNGTRIKCGRVHSDLPALYQDTSLLGPTAPVSPHGPNSSTMSPEFILHTNPSTPLAVGQSHCPVITSSQQPGIRPTGLSGQALAFRLHKNMKYIPQSFKESTISTNMQVLMGQLQEDDIWRITLFIVHTHQNSDTLRNAEKNARGQQLANMLNTLSAHCFEYKKSFIPSLSATRTTIHGLVGYPLYDASFSPLNEPPYL